MDLLRWIIGGVVTIVLAVLAVLNRAHTDFFWSPIHDPVSLPIYIIILFAAAGGFVFGTIITWMYMAPLRKLKRAQKQEIKTLEREVDKLNKSAMMPQAPAREMFTALPPKIQS